VEYSDEILKLKPAAPAGPAGAGKGPVPPGGAPGPMVRPTAPGAAPAGGGSSNAELIKMLQKQRGDHPAGTPAAGGITPTGTAPSTSSNPTQPGAVPPQPRRRVVLPTDAAGTAPAAPAATPAPAAPAAPAPAVPGN